MQLQSQAKKLEKGDLVDLKDLMRILPLEWVLVSLLSLLLAQLL